MSIKFVCSCGKRMRARDEMAGRRSVCPRCGNPVGIPAPQPARPVATPGPMTPAERLARQARTRRQALSETAGQLAVVPPELRVDPLEAVVDRRTARTLQAHPEQAAALRRAQSRAPRSLRLRTMGTAWYHCLFYPVRAWLLVGGLAVALMMLSVVVVFSLPEVVALETESPKRMLAWAAFAACCEVIVGYTFAFLHSVLISSVAGEVQHVPWPGRDFGMVAKATLIWLVCFLAGPVVPAAAALWLWLHWGDPVLMDQLIMAELGIVTASYWLLALVSVGQSGRLRDANPLRVADLAHQLGLGALFVVFVGGCLGIGHAYWACTAMIRLEREPGVGLLSLTACWLSIMYCETFLMRYLGLKCYKNRDVELGAVAAE
jgi:hypothetical protein